MSIAVVGLSYKTAPVEVRETFAASADVLPLILSQLGAHPDLGEAMFLSTCNRVEAFVSARSGSEVDTQAALAAVREVFAAHASTRADTLAPYLYMKSGDAAVRHIFRVASSLESMVVGEPQILGQVKDAYDLARKAGTLTGFLGRSVGRAFTVAKRVRTETSLGAGTVSISSVAVDLARAIFGDLAEHGVLLVGAGEMAEAAAKSLGKNARALHVCNRSFDKAVALASTFGGTAAPLDALEDELLFADVVVTSTGSRNFLITKDMVKRVMKGRKGRTLFFVDIAVPRNVEPDVHKIDNVYVYNVDDLERHVAEGMKSRSGEVTRAEAIVESELADFERWSRGLEAQPAVVALRAKTRGVFHAELERTLSSRLRHLPEGDRAALVQMVDSAVNKLLHAPTTRIKASAASGDERAEELVATLRHLFDLPETNARLSASGASTEKSENQGEDEQDAAAGRVTH